ncbi:hypothetical protein DXV76_04475 [Rhodobacteraceae bacterium CCMM004]|nr:hypothetical protein DXV76_04475 [Rhodobacteraceae bacterium CCMM004]
MRRSARALALAAALAGAGGPAGALSCLRPDPEMAFQRALNAEESYLVVSGRFVFDPAKMPQGGGDTRAVSVPARFSGSALTRNGFTVPVSTRLTLRVECLGPWCGSLDPAEPHLAFLERVPGGYALDVAACPSFAFARPSDAVLDRMRQCLLGSPCGNGG